MIYTLVVALLQMEFNQEELSSALLFVPVAKSGCESTTVKNLHCFPLCWVVSRFRTFIHTITGWLTIPQP